MQRENKIVAYTVKEKLLLGSLINKHKLVENKRTDAATIQKKQQEWECIAREYNSQADVISHRRTAMQLKKLWNNLKQRKRKATFELKHQMLLTGGGPPPLVETDAVMEAVGIAAPHMDVTLDCPWDNTTLYEKKMVLTDTSLADAADVLVSTVLSDSEMSDERTVGVVSSPRSPNLFTKESASTSTNTPNKNNCNSSGGSRKRFNFLESESSLRMEKLKEAIEQQAEFHAIRMAIEKENLKKAEAEARKMEIEKELAIMKLELFRKQNK